MSRKGFVRQAFLYDASLVPVSNAHTPHSHTHTHTYTHTHAHTHTIKNAVIHAVMSAFRHLRSHKLVV